MFIEKKKIDMRQKWTRRYNHLYGENEETKGPKTPFRQFR